MRIELATERALLSAGVAAADLDALVLAACRGSVRAQRHLERALGTELMVRRENSPGPCPAEHTDAAHRRDGIVIATLRLARGVRWEDGSLWCALPDTIRAALPGRRLGEIIAHPWLDPDLPTIEPRRHGAAVGTPRRNRGLVEPDAAGRLRVAWLRLRLLLDEMRTAGPAPHARRFHTGAAVGCLGIVALRTAAGGPIAWWAWAIMATATALAAVNAVNAWTARPLSLLKLATARHDHADEMDRRREEAA